MLRLSAEGTLGELDIARLLPFVQLLEQRAGFLHGHALHMQLKVRGCMSWASSSVHQSSWLLDLRTIRACNVPCIPMTVWLKSHDNLMIEAEAYHELKSIDRGSQHRVLLPQLGQNHLQCVVFSIHVPDCGVQECRMGT